MKQSELNQIKEIIECLIKKEVKKQLPVVINELLHKRQETLLEQKEPQAVEPQDKQTKMKTSLKELFSSGVPTETPLKSIPNKTYTKNSILNEVLNQTTPFRGMERMAAGIPSSVMSMLPPGVSVGASSPDNTIPGANIPQDVSALDIAKSVPLPKEVSRALTRNYSDMMKAIDIKKGKK
jgi:hypothetical protein